MSTRSFALNTLALAAIAGSVQAQTCPTSQKIMDANPYQSGLFGTALAMAPGGLNGSPLLVVGEPNRDATAGNDNRGGFTAYQKVNGNYVDFFSTTNAAGQDNEHLGWSIGASSLYVIAGAPTYSNSTGHVRVFGRPNVSSSFAAESPIPTPANSAGSRFGHSVAVSNYGGGWAVVGAQFHTVNVSESGAAFFYTRASGGTWNLAFSIQDADYGAGPFDHRGEAVAMSQSSEYAVVGAPQADLPGQPLAHGTALVVHRLANGTVSGTVTTLSPPSPESGEGFGAAVAIEGDVLVVGALDEDLSLAESGFTMQATNSGAIYIFERSGTNWNFAAKLRSPVPATNARFGAYVATDGTRVIASELNTHRAFTFKKVNGQWQHQASFADPDTAANGSFGSSVGVSGNDIAIGDANDDHTFMNDPGAVYVSTLDATAQTGDMCSNPIDLTPGDYLGCTKLATPTPLAGNITTCGNIPNMQSNDVWFAFTPTCSGSAIFDTFGSEFDTVLSVHSDCPNIGGTNTIACNDDASFPAPNNRASLVTFNFTGGETYLIRVGGYGTSNGQYTLRHSEYYGVANDTCTTAYVVGYGTHLFNNCAANTERTHGPGCGSGTSFHDLWYRFIAPKTETVTLDTCGSLFDTVLAVYQGTQCPADIAGSNAIACNDDGLGNCMPNIYSTQSKLTFNSIAGQTYLMQVSSYFDNNTGAGHLTITPELHCNDIDFNNDGSLFDPQDIDAFLSVYSEGPCIPASATCDSLDFNNDTSVFDPCDIDCFLLVFSEGPCTTCGM